MSAVLPQILTAASYALQIFQLLPQLIDAGYTLQQIKAISRATYDKLAVMIAEKRGPSPAEWDEMNAMVAEVRKEPADGETPKA